jgi:hypothetical protein
MAEGNAGAAATDDAARLAVQAAASDDVADAAFPYDSLGKTSLIGAKSASCRFARPAI